MHAWLDVTAGVAGDMLMGALVDAGGDLELLQKAVRAVAGEGVALRREPVIRAGLAMNRRFYVTMQGPSEMGASGRLVKWDRFSDLQRIQVPTLVVSGKYDTMDPRYMAAMAKQLPQVELAVTNGSHMAFYDDQPNYFAKLKAFLRKFR